MSASASQTFCCPPEPSELSSASHRIALIGNPNCGKTTLFNALTGLHARIGNYPGTTVERRSGRFMHSHEMVELIDLPGIYDCQAHSDDERVALAVIENHMSGNECLDGAIVVLDATNLSRSLFLASQLLERKIPVMAVLTMVDVAEKEGIQVDAARLAQEIGCPVIPILVRTGVGMAELRDAMLRLKGHSSRVLDLPGCGACRGCRFQRRYAWTDAVAERCTRVLPGVRNPWTERADRVLTHPVMGVLAFMAVMFGVFFLIFRIASVPMDLIDSLFSGLGAWIAGQFAESDARDLLIQGVIGGVGGVLVFLPQICILFFCLALLEDSGYLARAAFVMDRLMTRVGLSGRAFVPLLSAHACAIPAIMATRTIPERRDRLVTILIAPLMSCSARIPVYSMLAGLLFAGSPGKAALVFVGAYACGLVAALAMAFVFKKTLLKGNATPLVLELPIYKRPSLRTALMLVLDRSKLFICKAGTVILTISVLLWALSTYPKSEAPQEVEALRSQAREAAAVGASDMAKDLETTADRLQNHDALANSAAGRIGRWIEPVLSPLGFDWQIGIGIISSFAAREVVVSTLSVVYGVGEETDGENPESLYGALKKARRSDGSKVFTPATCYSLLAFYVLAMQCLPTQAVTRRETNSWKWPAIQLGYMSALAYLVALVVYQGLRACGVS